MRFNWKIILVVALSLSIATGTADAGLFHAMEDIGKGVVVDAAVHEGEKVATHEVENKEVKTLIIPKVKAEIADEYRKMAEEGKLIRTDPKQVRGSGFRKRLEREIGKPPSNGYDADHKVELCVGGADCAKTNGQWLEVSKNRSAGSKIGNAVKNDPIGTLYHKIEVESDEK